MKHDTPQTFRKEPPGAAELVEATLPSLHLRLIKRGESNKMQSVRQVQRLNDLELEKVVPSNASWHTDYRDTAYISIRGLPFELSEGDVLTICSQYGSPVDIKLARDKDTGKSRGFGWLKYEDQRSCDLAVDNLSGAGVLGRVIAVDHARYQKKEGEVETVGEDELGGESGNETEREGERRRKTRESEESGSKSEEERPKIKEEVELAQLMREHDEDDPMKAYLIQEKKAEVEQALKSAVKKRDRSKEKRHKNRQHRSRREDERDGHGDRRSNGHKSRRDRLVHSEDEKHHHHSHRRKRDRSASSASDVPERASKKSGGDLDHERSRRDKRESSSD